MIDQTFAIRGRLLLSSHLEPGTLVVSNGHIERIARGHDRNGDLPAAVIEADIVSPGLIDLQVNGAEGAEIGDDPARIEQVSRWLVRTGVTAWLPTVVTASPRFYPGVFESWSRVDTGIGARPLGLHLEGPFLTSARKGAHQLRYIEAATSELFDSWLEQDAIRLVTLAPEREEGLDRIRRLVERGISVSLGHTDATYDEFSAGIDAGATKATHLFNAMSPMHQRQPGAMIAAMTDDRVTAGMIPDAVHAHPATVRLALRAKGPERVVIVSDMMSATGLGPGTYELGGQTVFVDESTARLRDGTLAGSVLTMDQAVRNLVAWGDVPVGTAFQMCTQVPADLLGDRSRGRLIAGTRADLTLWTESLQVAATWVGGHNVWTTAETDPR
ncbi:MAG: N-acetylglucosamine-6-phosphate deacetylase [Chloroflexia bacterium]|nr:N-acetylglucosamine-6-phosphate deacetylase [Chloroflexia bacterium]